MSSEERQRIIVWEQFFNWQSDMDWAWGPLLPLRPPRASAMRPWVWVRLFLAFTLLGLILIGLLAVGCLLLPKVAASQHRPLPAPVAETLATLSAMVHDPGTVALLVGLALGLPPLFFGFCLPYHWAWNRRAMRLREQGEVETPPAPVAPDVWPPAPKGVP